jgi:D-alanyl-D-alanine carboxypeptidase
MSRKQVSIALSALAIGLTLPLPGVVQADQEEVRAGQVDKYLQTNMQARNLPGVSVAVTRGGAVILQRSYGFANLELGAATAPNSVFEIGTLSKQFTAAAVMMLVEEGKIALDDPIRTIIPELPESWSAVSVRHLLTHTSGLPSYTGVSGFYTARGSDASPTALVASVAKTPVRFKAGEGWATSNTDYLVLAMLIQRVSGKSYARFLTERIFQPFGLGATRVNDYSTIIKNRVSGYSMQEDSLLHNSDSIRPSRLIGSASIASSAADMAKWNVALTSGKVLKASSLEQMWTPAKLKNGTDTQYGFGWYVHKTTQGTIIEHGGTGYGFRSQVVRYPDNTTVSLFTNADQLNPYTLADNVHRITTGAPSVPAR